MHFCELNMYQHVLIVCASAFVICLIKNYFTFRLQASPEAEDCLLLKRHSRETASRRSCAP